MPCAIARALTRALDSTSCDDVHRDALFCDGYEDPTLSSWTAQVENNGTADRTTAMAYRGAAGLLCQSGFVGQFKEGRYDADRVSVVVRAAQRVLRFIYTDSTMRVERVQTPA